MLKYQPVRGTHDLFGDHMDKFQFVIETAKKVARCYGYMPFDTPVFEFTQVFTKSLGETTDVVGKEMYTFQDRGGESLTLRPEGTASVVRALISNGLLQTLPQKVFYAGPMFRYERPQKGRFRQFHQVGIEGVGIDNPWGDVEAIAMGSHFLKELGLGKDIILEINTLGDRESRLKFREALIAYFKNYESELSQDSQTRLLLNPLRILDSKDSKDKEISKEAPTLKNFLSKESQDFFDEVLKGLDLLGISYHFNPLLVRGLDYYNHTVFEFTTTSLGSQGQLLAGGRYDGLIGQMGGPDLAGVGWAAGVERLMEMPGLKKAHLPLSLCIVPMSSQEWEFSFSLTQTLRQAGFVVDIGFSGNPAKRMKKADKMGASFALLIGEDEIKENKATLRYLATGDQTQVAFDQLIPYLKSQFS